MKKIFFFFLSITLVAIVFWWYQNRIDQKPVNKHIRPSIGPTQTTTTRDKEKNITPKKSLKIPPTPAQAKIVKSIKRHGRTVIGLQANKYKNPNKNIIFKNSYNKNWKELLTNTLKNSLPNHDVDIETENSMILLDREGLGQYAEQVVITLIDNSKIRTSYRAMIDAENGDMIYTWDQTYHENDPRKNWQIQIQQ
ncbi:MAG: hypothetical protein ACOCUH_01560 [Bacteriovoracia bacterium]